MTEIQKSKCCNAEVRLGGMGDFRDDDKVCTNYYVCSKCNNPCDINIITMTDFIICKKCGKVKRETMEAYGEARDCNYEDDICDCDDSEGFYFK